MDNKEDLDIVRTWRSNRTSETITLSIPIHMCRKYGIKHHTHLLAIDTGQGILFKKLEVEKVK